MNYYVYYKVDPARLAGLRAEVERLFAAVERSCGVRGRWMQRRDDPSTYMEVYEDVTDESKFESVLNKASKSFEFQRRIERFECA